MSESSSHLRTIDMVAMLLERNYTPEMIATSLDTGLKRVKALISEVERQKVKTK